MENVRLDTLVRDPALVTPALVIDHETISTTYDRFVASFPGAVIDYAMKANANPEIVRHIVALGGGLEIASPAELQLALDAGATGDQIICSNPIKTPAFLQALQASGVYAVVVDSVYEVEKIARYAPGMRVYVRLAVDNTGAVLPLAGKFGVDGTTAIELVDLARDLGLKPIGLSFHVGSQCLNAHNWAVAIAACGAVWTDAAARGHRFTFLDIGGGYPAGHYHDSTIPTIEEIGGVVMNAVAEYIPYTPDLMLVLEPGRGLVGEAGRLVVSVVGKAMRGCDAWAYMDAGVFNGLMETYEGFPPVVRLLDDGVSLMTRSHEAVTLAGPSCDSCDVVARGLTLPELRIDDRLVFLDAGAYTNEYAAAFNGFPIPHVIHLRDESRHDQPQYEAAQEAAFAPA